MEVFNTTAINSNVTIIMANYEIENCSKNHFPDFLMKL